MTQPIDFSTLQIDSCDDMVKAILHRAGRRYYDLGDTAEGSQEFIARDFFNPESDQETDAFAAQVVESVKTNLGVRHDYIIAVTVYEIDDDPLVISKITVTVIP
jgi:hypothetical protein